MYTLRSTGTAVALAVAACTPAPDLEPVSADPFVTVVRSGQPVHGAIVTCHTPDAFVMREQLTGPDGRAVFDGRPGLDLARVTCVARAPGVGAATGGADAGLFTLGAPFQPPGGWSASAIERGVPAAINRWAHAVALWQRDASPAQRREAITAMHTAAARAGEWIDALVEAGETEAAHGDLPLALRVLDAIDPLPADPIPWIADPTAGPRPDIRPPLSVVAALAPSTDCGACERLDDAATVWAGCHARALAVEPATPATLDVVFDAMHPQGHVPDAVIPPALTACVALAEPAGTHGRAQLIGVHPSATGAGLGLAPTLSSADRLARLRERTGWDLRPGTRAAVTSVRGRVTAAEPRTVEGDGAVPVDHAPWQALARTVPAWLPDCADPVRAVRALTTTLDVRDGRVAQIMADPIDPTGLAACLVGALGRLPVPPNTAGRVTILWDLDDVPVAAIGRGRVPEGLAATRPPPAVLRCAPTCGRAAAPPGDTPDVER